MKPHARPLLGLIAAALSSATAEEVKRFEPTGSLPYLSVEESLKTFHLPEDYRLEPVLTEPVIADPEARWKITEARDRDSPPGREIPPHHPDGQPQAILVDSRLAGAPRTVKIRVFPETQKTDHEKPT